MGFRDLPQCETKVRQLEQENKRHIREVQNLTADLVVARAEIEEMINDINTLTLEELRTKYSVDE